MRVACLLFTLLFAAAAHAEIPATPVMTLYRFNGPPDIPTYDVDQFRRSGPSTPAGSLAQGSSVIPCLVVEDGEPLTDRQGVPYVGFQVVVDARTATPASTARFQAARDRQRNLAVANHHCPAGVRQVLDVRNLYAMSKAPAFDPPRPATSARETRPAQGELDRIVRAFHNSAAGDSVNRRLIGRRAALQAAWDRFIGENRGRWPAAALERARHLDYVLRTALFEGHLERGCSGYGTCERNIIALSIRNRALESCARSQGCAVAGDFAGVASKVSQYNIWDEYLTQVSGLTACYLRDDLGRTDDAAGRAYRRLQQLYAQNRADVERILFGGDRDLQAIFPGNSLADLKALKHYYHAPAMGKCFPDHPRVEYISGAVARKGGDFALVADTRVQVDERVPGGYRFRGFLVQDGPLRDAVRIVDTYHGFVLDDRRVTLQPTSRCTAYGIPAGCRFTEIGRYRRTPTWVNTGRPLEVRCRVQDRGEQCQGSGTAHTARVGGVCDTEMRPFTGIP